MTNVISTEFGLLGERQALPTDARNQILALGGPRPWLFLRAALFAWVIIFGAIGWAAFANNIWVSLLVILIVATRQNVLGLLVHEQAHCLGFPARGDVIANLLAAYPLLVLTVESYAQVHLSHHKYFFTDKDPDFLRKSGPDWTFPMPPWRFARLILGDLIGFNVWRLLKGKRLEGGAFKRPHPTPKWIRLAFYGSVAVALTVTHTWHLFLLYWLLPLVTVFQVIVRWGAVCEHKYNLRNATIGESSPIIVPRWWEMLLLPNLNFALHPYHHLFPGVSYSNLPRVHEIFRGVGLIDDTRVFHGYGAYLKYLLRPITSIVSGKA
jgi:fatty acid desaturase